MTSFLVWLIIAFLFLIFELGSPGLFYFLSFGAGALVAAITSLFIPSIIVQSLVFLGSTVCALLALHYWVLKRRVKYPLHHRTNIYALQGKHGYVTKQITLEKPGYVKVNGEIWLARTEHEGLDVDDKIEIVTVRGAHLVVKKLKK